MGVLNRQGLGESHGVNRNSLTLINIDHHTAVIDLHPVTASGVLDDLSASNLTELNLPLEDLQEVISSLKTG